MAAPKYIVGIDLGTTNTVVTCSTRPIEGDDELPAIKDFQILQEFALGAVEERPVLPSFLFNRLQEKPCLPWTREVPFIVGEFARERGAEVPSRCVGSAKSWLCNPRIDRRQPVLPWGAPEGVDRISPLAATAEILAHIRHAWNQKNAKAKLEDQMVIITIPASFDAGARDLTLEAAKLAGLPAISLLEEPQASFYAWIAQSTAPWRDQVKKGEVVLVVDVGGGTTDFSLIEVGEANGDLTLERVAVGHHILLGGDNMDLTLAWHLRRKLEAAKKKVDQAQTLMLTHACRKAKENLFANPDLESEPVVISGRGSSVIGGSLKTTLERGELEQILVDGFFPPCALTDKPKDDTGVGFREINLAYAADPAITRHLADFLDRQGATRSLRHPQAILFNGGVFGAARFRERLVEVIDSWLAADGKPPIRVLAGGDLARSVATGATYYGIVRDGRGIRIRGGVAQAYYLGIETAQLAVPGMTPPLKALCVAPMGMEEGTAATVEGHAFALTVGRPVEFKFFKANARRDDRLGQLLDEVPADAEPTTGLTLTLPPGEGLEPGTPVPVQLEVKITEIGTLEIWCQQQGGNQRWQLEFNVRDAIR